jgi:hypothetical protein
MHRSFAPLSMTSMEVERVMMIDPDREEIVALLMFSHHYPGTLESVMLS